MTGEWFFVRTLTVDFGVIWLILFVLAVILLIYLIAILHNVNESAKVIKSVLRRNEENVDNIVDNCTLLSKTIVEPVKAATQVLNRIKNSILKKK